MRLQWTALPRMAAHRWRLARRPVLTVTGLGFISAAGWTLAVPLGLLLIGISCLTLEALSDRRSS